MTTTQPLTEREQQAIEHRQLTTEHPTGARKRARIPHQIGSVSPVMG
jgi:hypothetical protein